METDALLEAFGDFEKKGKNNSCPVLEQFVCHVAKTGKPTIPWSQFKPYFMFKLEKVMDDFHASAPEQRQQNNPNMDFVPFEEMKKRILNIVDSYIGIPFTIQRLCELLVDPKRNYTGIEKFLMGLEKNVMVVSCMYPASEKNGTANVNRVNGVPGSPPLCADSQNLNGPGIPKSLNRPKVSTNGLSVHSVTEQPEPTRVEAEGHPTSDSSPSEGVSIPSSGKRSKEAEGDCDTEQSEVKRVKLHENREAESEEKDSSHLEAVESLSSTPVSSKDTCSQENAVVTSAPSSTQTDPSERRDNSSETADDNDLQRDSPVEPCEQPVLQEAGDSSEQEDETGSGDEEEEEEEEDLPGDKQVNSSSHSPDLSTDGSTEISHRTSTATDTGDLN